MGTVQIIRHVMFEDLGSLEDILQGRGHHIKYSEAGYDHLDDAALLAADLLVICGGPIGANDERDYPFLLDEIRIIAARIKADQPTLGICLGAQLIAKALGAAVYPHDEKEIGWQGLNLTPEGRTSVIAPLGAENTSMLHWHGDTFDLPNKVVLLASTNCCRHQVFSIGRTLAFQCHPEVTPRSLERWYIGHAAELGAHETSITSLREESYRLGPELVRQASICYGAWFRDVGL